ncbi:MAG: alkaline phosphatase family protein [Candidatus Paceibacterota bacterium]|jgi:predicted AlkP superfamily phosphohydrolase/phosphomutase
MQKRKIIVGLVAIVLLFVGYITTHDILNKYSELSTKSAPKLYWFIPDGFRADPGLFNLYAWAKEGKLPNIAKMIKRGSYGYAYPNFPSHTPTNFATLLTGAYPEINGVNDGPMHAIGKPLDKVAIAGFRSVAKKVPAIWKTLEDSGYKVSILSIPGSTPPEVNKGEVYRGRWGGWGYDVFPINFETKGDLSQRIKQGRATKLFFFGPQLAQYIDGLNPQGWENAPKSYSEPQEIKLDGWGSTVYGYIYDSTNDQKKNYNRISFSVDKKIIFADLAEGEWSDWQSVILKWKQENAEVQINSSVKAMVIKLDDDAFFRVRLVYDGMNESITYPTSLAEQIRKAIGPMVDFADNFPPQLVYYPEDKKAFMDEADMSFVWHKKAVSVVNQIGNPDVVIHDIYTPNQMLTSRWWMGYVDPNGSLYNTISDTERAKLWQEVQNMYKKTDDIVGEILKIADKNTYVVLSSDHGAVPLNRRVNLNNLFAKNGWLKFQLDPKTGEPIIDWKNTKVIYLKMAHVYINPNGLAGNYERATGTEYLRLRSAVEKAIKDLKDVDGKQPLAQAVEWENVKEKLKLDPDRAGDLVIANNPGFGWGEEMSTDFAIFTNPLETGYKQAIKAENVPGMWTPFIIMGPGVKENNFLGEKPFELIDEYPTIMSALKVALPTFVQGKTIPVFK